MSILMVSVFHQARCTKNEASVGILPRLNMYKNMEKTGVSVRTRRESFTSSSTNSVPLSKAPTFHPSGTGRTKSTSVNPKLAALERKMQVLQENKKQAAAEKERCERKTFFVLIQG